MEIVKQLKEDPELYRAYQDNIAMSFKDTYHNYKKASRAKYLNKRDIHAIANNAAINFLNLLIRIHYSLYFI